MAMIRKIKQFIRKRGNILLLDGIRMGTTKLLLENNITKPEYIYVPEIDPETQKVHANSMLCNSFDSPLSELIDNMQEKEANNINIFYGDYTGTVTGNKNNNMYPLYDLSRILNKTKHDKILVALTFSRRLKLLKRHKDSNDKILNDFIIPCIKKSQFNILNDVFPLTYKRDKKSQPMFHAIFELQKDSSIDPSTIKLKKKRGGKLEGYPSWYKNFN